MKYSYKITLWCETDLENDSDLAMALEQGELWDVAQVQYNIEGITRA